MFTGIVEAVGRVVAREIHGAHARLVVEAPELVARMLPGASVAVNGACLTVREVGERTLGFDAVRETLERTALGSLETGSRVNLERALRADGRLDGHWVQGHVDATGRVHALERQGHDVRLHVDCPAGFGELLVPKGSVAIDGVSLTLVGVGDERFDVALIPHTLEATTLGERRSGDSVNLEADILGKYVKAYLERVLEHAGGSSSSRA